MEQSEQDLRKEICKIGRRMYQFGFSPCNSGNISARLGTDSYLITPSGVCKEDLTPDQIVKINGRSEVLSGTGHASSESRVHIYCYTHRPDVMGVVHAHAPFSVAFACMDKKLDRYFLPDQVYYLGAVPHCPYQPAGTAEVAESMAPYISRHSALLLGNHGSVTMGETLADAYGRLEMLEQLCKVSFLTGLAGGAREFSGSEAAELFREIEESGMIHPGILRL